MKRQFLFLPIILILLITSCGPSTEKVAFQTVTAATPIAASWIKTSTITPTFTSTPTFTPTLTFTPTRIPTITPTPLGGGSGQIACRGCVGEGIYLIGLDGKGATLLADYEDTLKSPFEWSKDGKKLVYLDRRGSSGQVKYFICVVNAYGNNEKKCIDTESIEFALSLDGTELIINETSGITEVNIDSGEKRIIVKGNGFYGYIQSPSWSPDGTKIVYAKSGGNVYSIYVINVDGTNETRLVSNAYAPMWSPDGTRIAYIVGNDDQLSIILMNADGTNKVRLTPNYQMMPGKWSSDGKFIVFPVITVGTYRDPKITDLYVVDVVTQKVLRLTKSSNVTDYYLSYDGTMISIAYLIQIESNLYQPKSYLMNMDGTILMESQPVGPWRP